MNNFKSWLYAGAAMSALLPVAAHAEGGGPWGGFYAGVLGGADAGDASIIFDRIKKSTGLVECTKPSHCASAKLGGHGIFGGVALGYNYHLAPETVVGKEIDVTIGGFSANEDSGFIYGSTSTKAIRNLSSVDVHASGTVRGRIGYLPVPDTLIYATGGLAWAWVSSSFRMEKYTGCASLDCDSSDLKSPRKRMADHDGAMLGGAIGAGVERMIPGSNARWKLEYLYTHYFLDTTEGKDFLASTQVANHALRLGLNFALGERLFPTESYTPVATGDSWDGHYAGVLLGGSFGDADFVYDRIKKSTGLVECTKASHCFAGSVGGGGLLAGLTLGYNQRLSNSTVGGIEADATIGGFSGSEDSGFIYGSKSSKAVRNLSSVDVHASGTLRGRIGFTPQPDTLLYLTGGMAWALQEATYRQEKYSGCSSFACDSSDLKSPRKKLVDRDNLLLGGVFGAGVERQINGGAYTWKAEYLATGYFADTFEGKDFIFSNDTVNHSFRVGINRPLH